MRVDRQTETRDTWIFDNGVQFFKDQLTESQLKRYSILNLHEPEESALMEEVLRAFSGEGIFLDVGSAAGYYCFLARKLVPTLEIHAINPHPNFRRMMQENMDLNAACDFQVHPVGISDSVQQVYLDNGWGSSIKTPKLSQSVRLKLKQLKNSLGLKKNEVFKENNVKIRTTTLEILLGQLDKDVFLMKMDIQGQELNALKGAGASISRIHNVIIGTHGEKRHTECLAFLKSAGFGVTYESLYVAHQPDGIIVGKRHKT